MFKGWRNQRMIATMNFVLQVYTNIFVSQNFSTIIFVVNWKLFSTANFAGGIANFNGNLRGGRFSFENRSVGWLLFSKNNSMKILIIPVILLGVVLGSCAQTKQKPATTKSSETTQIMKMPNSIHYTTTYN